MPGLASFGCDGGRARARGLHVEIFKRRATYKDCLSKYAGVTLFWQFTTRFGAPSPVLPFSRIGGLLSPVWTNELENLGFEKTDMRDVPQMITVYCHIQNKGSSVS